MTSDEVKNLLKRGYDIRGFRGKNQPKWHDKVYHKWRDMWKRCYDPTNPRYKDYKDVIIADEFKLFSNYLKWIKSQSNFDLFCETHDDICWSVDKDIIDSNNRNYFPECMSLVTRSENNKEANSRTKRKSVIGISLDNSTIFIFNSELSVENKGFDQGAVGRCCQGKTKSHKHKGFRWYYLKRIKL